MILPDIAATPPGALPRPATRSVTFVPPTPLPCESTTRYQIVKLLRRVFPARLFSQVEPSIVRFSIALLLLLVAPFVAVAHPTSSPAIAAEPVGQWVSLFNGKDLEGWTPKIRGYALGENFGNTFRVEDGLLKVGYDKYDKFDERFGHLFYKTPYSNYRFRVEYRFVGNQCPGGPGWAVRNSGVMIHGEDPAGMAKDQDFPASIEVQLLGGNGTDPRTTSNLCTPGTHVVMNGELIKRHCTSSTSKTYHGDQWVTAEIEVHGAKLIRHLLDGESVLEYNEPQLDEGDAHAKELAAKQGKMLKGGTISLQSESHPIEFRKVEIMVLSE